MFDSYSDDIASDIEPSEAEQAYWEQQQQDLEQAIYDAQIADLGESNE